MKNLSKHFIILLAVSLLIISCKENKPTDSNLEKEIDSTEVKAAQLDKFEVMKHATALPRYMSVILSNKEALNIDANQEQQLTDVSKEKSPQAVKMAYKIVDVEKEIHQLSLDNAKKELLATNFEKSLELRANLATMKLDCRDKVLEILNEQQWNDLIALYQEKLPFDNREGMKALIAHVNPLPNYMQLIQNDIIKLDEKQDVKLSEWSGENHPKMMELANNVIALEKNIYELSMNKGSREDILANVEEIAVIKRQIIATKTDCRDNLINTILSEEQWEKLSSK